MRYSSAAPATVKDDDFVDTTAFKKKWEGAKKDESKPGDLPVCERCFRGERIQTYSVLNIVYSA